MKNIFYFLLTVTCCIFLVDCSNNTVKSITGTRKDSTFVNYTQLLDSISSQSLLQFEQVDTLSKGNISSGSAIIVDYVAKLKNIQIKIPKIILADTNVQEIINIELNVTNLSGLTDEEVIQQRENYYDYDEDSLSNGTYSNDFGLQEIAYEVTKNSDSVLSINFIVTTVDYLLSATNGRYPVNHVYLNFDLNTGNQIKIEDMIRKNMMGTLLNICNKKLQTNYLKAKKENPDFHWYSYEGYKFEETNLSNFYFNEKGLCFYYDFNFMHCDAYASPDQTIELNKKELKELLLSNKYGL